MRENEYGLTGKHGVGTISLYRMKVTLGYYIIVTFNIKVTLILFLDNRMNEHILRSNVSKKAENNK
jgi:hypothetical protein